jgi:hypothetical protein
MNKTVIVSGSRTITDYDVVKQVIESSPWFGSIAQVYVGDAKGVDALVVRWCKENGIGYTIFRAEWGRYGRSAGPERNGEMIQQGGEALIAVWDGESKGTKDMMRQARKHSIPVHSVEVKREAFPIGDIRHV